MSDFLSNLVARNLNLIEVITPRLPALFEPPQGVSGTVAELPPDIENETVRAARYTATRDTLLSDRLEPTIHAVAHRSVGLAPEAPLSEVNPRLRIDPFYKSPGDIPATPGPQVREHRGLQKPPLMEGPEIAVSIPQVDRLASPFRPSVSSEISSSHASRPARSSVVAEREIDRVSDHGGVHTRRTMLESVIEERASELNTNQPATVREGAAIPTGQPTLAQASSLKPDMQHTFAEQTGAPAVPASVQPFLTRTARTVTARLRVTPGVKPAVPTLAEPLEAPQSAPTVQVTIGRIEVRATPPSIPSQSRRPTPPVMSLDEYLNQRGRRGNR